jgi:hypothetical protein
MTIKLIKLELIKLELIKLEIVITVVTCHGDVISLNSTLIVVSATHPTQSNNLRRISRKRHVTLLFSTLSI